MHLLDERIEYTHAVTGLEQQFTDMLDATFAVSRIVERVHGPRGWPWVLSQRAGMVEWSMMPPAGGGWFSSGA